MALSLSLAGYAVVLLLLTVRVGAVTSWGYLGVSSMTPAFADLRNITSALDCYRDGLDPLVVNPCDPWQRPMNYPRVFLGLARTGLGQRDTVWLGSVLLLVFAGAVLVFLDPASRIETVVDAAVVCSPAVMLAVERGNTDLVIFDVLVLALLLLRRPSRRRLLAYVVIGAASILKFYPIVAMSSAVRERPQTAVLVLSTIVGAFLAYLALTWKDVALINATVPARWVMSYGRAVVFLALEHKYRIAHAEKWSIASAFVVCWGAYLLARRAPTVPGVVSTHVDAFRIGASIYVGTFWLGTNWDYRLLFLILVVPQLLEWAASDRQFGSLATGLLGAVLFTMWSALPSRWLPTSLGHGVFALKELTNWTLLFSLLYLVLKTLPPWVSSRLFSPVAHTRSIPAVAGTLAFAAATWGDMPALRY